MTGVVQQNFNHLAQRAAAQYDFRSPVAPYKFEYPYGIIAGGVGVMLLSAYKLVQAAGNSFNGMVRPESQAKDVHRVQK